MTSQRQSTAEYREAFAGRQESGRKGEERGLERGRLGEGIGVFFEDCAWAGGRVQAVAHTYVAAYSQLLRVVN